MMTERVNQLNKVGEGELEFSGQIPFIILSIWRPPSLPCFDIVYFPFPNPCRGRQHLSRQKESNSVIWPTDWLLRFSTWETIGAASREKVHNVQSHCHTKRKMGRTHVSFGMTQTFKIKIQKLKKKSPPPQFFFQRKSKKLALPRTPTLLRWRRLRTLGTFLHDTAHLIQCFGCINENSDRLRILKWFL